MADQVPCEKIDAETLEREIDGFSALLHAVVMAGASVNFVAPFPIEEAEAFWRRKVLPPLRDEARALWALRHGRQVVGTVQLDLDTPPNQPHRAEIAKLLVHPEHRRQGFGRALMAALEREAWRRGRTLLTLDTRTGDAAEPLYASIGYRTVGVIPDYCRAVFEDRLDGATLMAKQLTEAPSRPCMG